MLSRAELLALADSPKASPSTRRWALSVAQTTQQFQGLGLVSPDPQPPFPPPPDMKGYIWASAIVELFTDAPPPPGLYPIWDRWSRHPIREWADIHLTGYPALW